MHERRLLTPDDSPHQSVVRVDCDPHAEVEPHTIATSESIYVLFGTFEASTSTGQTTIGPGDLCHFPAGSSHGLRCLDEPGSFLAIFAPST